MGARFTEQLATPLRSDHAREVDSRHPSPRLPRGPLPRQHDHGREVCTCVCLYILVMCCGANIASCRLQGKHGPLSSLNGAASRSKPLVRSRCRRALRHEQRSLLEPCAFERVLTSPMLVRSQLRAGWPGPCPRAVSVRNLVTQKSVAYWRTACVLRFVRVNGSLDIVLL
jgi:hypothetical protein